ncbi:hypothetical protein AMELA_G00288910, partial [Ameiurus melas]
MYKCSITDEGGAALASALRSNSLHLRELNLLSDLLKDPHCNLETLHINYNPLTRTVYDRSLTSNLFSRMKQF